jgi:hypothetical protein
MALYLLRRALPCADAGCPVGAILVNIYFETKTEFSNVRSISIDIAAKGRYNHPKFYPDLKIKQPQCCSDENPFIW